MKPSQSKKEKVAVVTIRYGIGIGGGAETLARKYAEALTRYYQVDVITTKAVNHVTWANELKEDTEIINDVTVKRFPVDFERKMDAEFFNIQAELDKNPWNIELGLKFMKIQGPYSSSLLEYLQSNKDDYKYVLYCPYLYATTFFGLQNTNKSSNVLIPAAHDEPFLHFHIMRQLFNNVSKVIFLTEEEEKLVQELYPGKYKTAIIGMGIESAIPSPDFLKRNNIKNPYIIYVGRIEEGKSVNELIEYFIRYKSQNKTDLDLILVGKSIMPIPDRKDIIHLGYLSEEDKIAAIKNSEFLVLSSQFESFSIVTLEALLAQTPVLVNGKCEVLKGHCLKSNAGLWYTNYEEFELAVKYFIEHEDERKEMSENGKKYVEVNYSIDTINQKLINFLP